MLVYRLCKKQYASDLSGSGARKYGGRWNYPGTSLLYTSEAASLAALELLVHLRIEDASMPFIITTLDVGNSIKVVEENDLPKDWQSADGSIYLMNLTDIWIEEQQSVALKVPSVILPIENNILLNPEHPKFSNVKIVSQQDFSFDKRLFFV
jgi:RES domain-containing protein